MITITPASFLAVSDDRQTSTKVSKLIVNYETSLGQKEGNPQGYIGSWVFDEQGTNIMQSQKIDENTDPKFKGLDILEVLTSEYVTQLQALNPNVEIVNSFVK